MKLSTLKKSYRKSKRSPSPKKTHKRSPSPKKTHKRSPKKTYQKSKKIFTTPKRKNVRRKIFSTPQTPSSNNSSPQTPSSNNSSPQTPSSNNSPPQQGRRASVYCGNNALSPRLVANGGNEVLGTLYQCLKKGIGFALHSPPDLNFINYQPIDPPDNFYCGDRLPLPDQYDAFGKRSTCLKRGVGIGKKILLQRLGLI